MGKNKLEKFADMASYPHVFEYPYSAVDNVPFDMKGKWHKEFFKNDHPIVLELGCGRGEYTAVIRKRILSGLISKERECGLVQRKLCGKD